MCVGNNTVVTPASLYGPYTAPLTTTSSQASTGSGVYVDQNMQYAQYLAPPQQYQTSGPVQNSHADNLSPIDQNGPASGKLDVRLSGHARAVSLPASVVMQSSVSNAEQQTNGVYEIEQRMYALGLEASE